MRLLVLALLLAHPGAAAVAPPEMARPPAAGAWKAFKAPLRVRFDGPGGLPVVYIEDRRSSLLTLRLAVRGGTALGGERNAGLVQALAELLTEGSEKHTALALAEAADATGGRLSASATPDHVVVTADGLADKADALLSLLAETISIPAFPEAEVALRKENMLTELKLRRSEPHWLAETALHRALYGEHPYAVYGPSEASIARIDRMALSRLHKKLFTPQNAVLVAVGSLPAAEFRAKLEAALAVWSVLPELPVPPMPPPAPRAGRALSFVERPGSSQSVFAAGRLAPRETEPGYDALRVADMILGGSFAARLTSDLREDKGWTYGIYSSLEATLATGGFFVRSQVRGEVTRPALDAVLAHLERLRKTQPTAAELEQAKSLLAGRFVRELETQEGLADAVLHDALFGLPDDRLDGFIARVRAVSAKQVQDAAARWMSSEGLAIAVVGDAAAAKALEGLAPLTRVGDDGRPR